MVMQKYRWDFVGLSTDSKPTATSQKVVDGSTFYEADTSKLFVWCNDQWYEKAGITGTGDMDDKVDKSSFEFDDDTDTLTITIDEE